MPAEISREAERGEGAGMTTAGEDVIVVPRGPNQGIWCRTQAAYDIIAAAATRRPALGAMPLDSMPAPGSYTGIVVTVATPEKWRELEAALALHGMLKSRRALSAAQHPALAEHPDQEA